MFQKCARCALKREGGDSLCGDQTLMPFHTNITILAMPTTEVSVQPALETIDSLSDPLVTRGGGIGGWMGFGIHPPFRFFTARWKDHPPTFSPQNPLTPPRVGVACWERRSFAISPGKLHTGPDFPL